MSEPCFLGGVSGAGGPLPVVTGDSPPYEFRGLIADMEVKIQFPDPVAQEVLGLPDRDGFVSRAVAQALDRRRSSRAAKEPRRPASPPLNDRQREAVWRREHREFLQDHFAGQWVVLEGEQIVAHDENAARAVAEARDKGVAVPFVFFVEPPRQPGVVRLGL